MQIMICKRILLCIYFLSGVKVLEEATNLIMKEQNEIKPKKLSDRSKFVLKLLLFLSPAIFCIIFTVGFIIYFAVAYGGGFVFSAAFQNWFPVLIPQAICVVLYLITNKIKKSWVESVCLVCFIFINMVSLYLQSFLIFVMFGLGGFRHSDSTFVYLICLIFMFILYLVIFIFFTVDIYKMLTQRRIKDETNVNKN